MMQGQCHNFFMNEQRIIFYDGECGLCQRSIAFLARADLDHKLKFAPLNGETYFHSFQVPAALDTVVYSRNQKIYFKSDAIIEALIDVGYRWSICLKIIPRFLRNIVYDFIASQRKKVSCPYLKRDERFLK